METTTIKVTKRQLLLRDSIAFLSLIAITAALFVVTLFLFRSFQLHRTELAIRWSDRGLAAFQAHRPEQAITAYRTALTYAPDQRSYELMLAEALGQSGRIEESYNYFLNLWETSPGDGSINLQLARLAAKKHDVAGAIRFYRASIYGNWQGDGVQRRREARLELAQYLIEQDQAGPARTELLIAGGNAPDTPEIDLKLAVLLEQANAAPDALTFYQKALAHQPDNQSALSHAGHIAYAMGNYTKARDLLEQATKTQPAKDEDVALLAKAERILQILPSASLPSRQRVERLLTARTIAKQRLNACTGTSQDALQLLTARWSGEDANATPLTLLHDSDKQSSLLQLIYDTEIVTSQQCTPPTGDDALLLLLARTPKPEGVSHP